MAGASLIRDSGAFLRNCAAAGSCLAQNAACNIQCEMFVRSGKEQAWTANSNLAGLLRHPRFCNSDSARPKLNAPCSGRCVVIDFSQACSQTNAQRQAQESAWASSCLTCLIKRYHSRATCNFSRASSEDTSSSRRISHWSLFEKKEQYIRPEHQSWGCLI